MCISQFLWDRAQLSSILCFKVFKRWTWRWQGYSLSWVSHGEGFASKPTWLLQRSVSYRILGHGPQLLASHWLEAILGILPCGPLWQDTTWRLETEELARKIRPFSNMIDIHIQNSRVQSINTYILLHLLCAQVPPTHKGRRWHEHRITRIWVS